MDGGKASAQIASESEYTFKSVVMVSPCWSVKQLVVDFIENAREEKGTRFYASYSWKEDDPGMGDTEPGTRDFVDETLGGHLDAEPFHLSAVCNHETAVWDIATTDEDGDGRADIWDVLFAETPTTSDEKTN